MTDLGINEMQEMQKKLQEKYKDKCEQISPEQAYIEKFEKNMKRW